MRTWSASRTLPRNHHVSPAEKVQQELIHCLPGMKADMLSCKLCHRPATLVFMTCRSLCFANLCRLSSCPSTIFTFRFCLRVNDLGSAKVCPCLCLHAMLSGSPCAASLDPHHSKPTCKSTAAHHCLLLLLLFLLILLLH